MASEAPRFRWFSATGEYAFLSFGGMARGVIAIGGVAHGIIAFGGIASFGVISVGMNAGGSVFALGMNAIAPISISLINGVGFVSLAGVNSWGSWSGGGVNSIGVESSGGVNSDVSIVPTVVLFVVGMVVSVIFRGRRPARRGPPTVDVKELRSGKKGEGWVRGRLTAVHADRIELEGEPALAGSAAACTAAGQLLAERRGRPVRVLARLLVGEELREPGSDAYGYREAPEMEVSRTLRCLELMPVPPPRWLLSSAAEVQWIMAWTLRAAVLVVAAVLVLGR